MENNMEELTQLVQSLETELTAYNAKPTKAASARIRKLTLQIGKQGPSIRKQLIELDRKGY